MYVFERLYPLSKMQPIEFLVDRLIAPASYISDEAFEKFRENINQKIKGKKCAVVAHYEMPLKNLEWEYDFQWTYDVVPIEFVNYESVHNTLKEADIHDHTENICSILQEHFYRLMLCEINKPYYDNLSQVKEFAQLNDILTKDIEQIKISTNRKDEYCTIRNKTIINLLLACYVEKVLLNKDILAYRHLSLRPEDNLVKNNILNSAILNTLVYIAVKTDFEYNKSQNELFDGKFSNKQFQLIFELLGAVELINTKEIESEPKDFIGNRVRRSLAKPKNKDLFTAYLNPPTQGPSEPIPVYSEREMEEIGMAEVFRKQEEEIQKIKDAVTAILDQLIQSIK